MEKVLFVDWRMSTGFPGAEREGTVDICLSELEGRSEEEQEKVIREAIWEAALNFVDVSPTRRYYNDEDSGDSDYE